MIVAPIHHTNITPQLHDHGTSTPQEKIVETREPIAWLKEDPLIYAMDPFHEDSGIDVVKASSILANNDSSTTPTNNRLSTSYPNNNNNTTYSSPLSISESESEIPTLPPPAYHTIVSANMPFPNITSPYDPLQQEEPDSTNPETSDDDTDTPEIIINAATQIRGNGNIISIAQMDSVRLANLISAVLTGDTSTSSTPTTNNAEGEDAAATTRPPTPITPTTRERTSTTQVRGVKRFSNINITVNCGATIIGDRNIVGPGLGEIARQMQIAQRNQAALLIAQQRAAAARGMAATTTTTMGGQGVKLASPQNGGAIPSGVAIPVGVATPPMSRSTSLNSEAGGWKRKSEDGAEAVAAKRRC